MFWSSGTVISIAGDIAYVHINHPLIQGSLLINVKTPVPNLKYAQVIADITLGLLDHERVITPVAVLTAILSLLNIFQDWLLIFPIDNVV